MKLLTLLSAAVLLAQTSFASDSNANLPNGFDNVLNNTSGAIIRVPVSEDGLELTSEAEIRLHNGAVDANTDLSAAFDTAVDASTQPSVSEEDITKDSSTHGWFRRNRCCGYRYNGWHHNYYRHYQPSYYYYGSYYRYSYASYYQTYRAYNPWNTYGYRYYYYSRWY